MTSKKQLKIISGVFDFGTAIQLVKQGCKVSRDNSQGNWFIFLVPGSKFVINRAPLDTILAPGTEINYRPHIDIMYDLVNRSAETKVAVFVPNMGEMLAEDWVEVEAV